MGVETQSFEFLFQAIIISLLLSIPISAVYYEYLRRGGSWRIASQFLFIIPVLISLFLVFYIPIASNSAINSLFSFVFSLIFLLFAGKLPKFKCKHEEFLGKIENIPIFVRHEKREKIYNAWYNHRKKRICITKALFDILSEEERKAVLYHEIGHSKVKLWDVTTRITCLL